MPAKNKPKRLDRSRSWRVARRKRKRALIASGKSRTRAKRPKHKGVEKAASKPIEKKVSKTVASPKKEVVKKDVKK